MSGATRNKPDDGQRLVMHGIDWDRYEKLLDALGDRPMRLTFDRGTLEIMAPSWDHEWWDSRVYTVVLALSQELVFDMQPGGSTTFRREDLARGLEPDQCFYLKNARRVAKLHVIDLRRDPPPDLALEVDIASSSLDRMSIYAALRVPEVWRIDGENLHFFRLRKSAYDEVERSVNFPFLTSAEVQSFLFETSGLLVSALFPAATRWARERIRPLWEAHQQRKPGQPSRRNGGRR
jgi:Uma2 family endonuclease